MQAGSHSPELSPEQLRTWLLYAQGVPMKVIAADECRTIGAIEMRLRRVCDATGTPARIGLIKAAVDRGLIEHGTLPTLRKGRCPCCGDLLPAKDMRVLVELYHGHGFKTAAQRLGISLNELSKRYAQLNKRFGGRGAQHYVADAVRSGLLKAWMDANGSDNASRVGVGGNDHVAGRDNSRRGGGVSHAHILRSRVAGGHGGAQRQMRPEERLV